MRVEPCSGRAPAVNLWAPPPPICDDRRAAPIICRRAADATLVGSIILLHFIFHPLHKFTINVRDRN